MIKARKKKTAGMSIVELVISVAVFAIVFAPMLSLMTHSIKADRRAIIHNLATTTAQLILEDAYGRPLDDPVNGTGLIQNGFDDARDTASFPNGVSETTLNTVATGEDSDCGRFTVYKIAELYDPEIEVSPGVFDNPLQGMGKNNVMVRVHCADYNIDVYVSGIV